MIRYLEDKKAQSILEYAMTVACIVAALLMMQIYIKRAMQGRLHQAADSIGEQYDARYVSGNVTLTQTGTINLESRQERIIFPMAEEGKVDGISTTVNSTGTVRRSGYESLSQFPSNLYD